MSQAPGLRVRAADLARADDLAAFCRLMAEFAAEPVSAKPELGAAHFERVALDLAQRSGVVVLLAARAHEAPEGVLVAFEGYSTFAQAPLLNVHDVHVSPAARGRGLGTALMSAIEDVAIARGSAKITLEVAASNHGAVRLYRRLGYLGLAPVLEEPSALSAPGGATYFATKPLPCA